MVVETPRLVSAESAASREELVRALEALSGRKIRTREDVKALLAETAAAPQRNAAGWNTAKSLTLLALLGFAALQYYVLDVMVQIASLPQLTVFVAPAQSLL